MLTLYLPVTDEGGEEKTAGEGDEFASVTESELAEGEVAALSDDEGRLLLI